MDIAIHATSPLILTQALAHQLKTILDARLAQGYVRKRSVISVGKQLLPILTILVSSGLTTALERGDIWKQDDILSLIAKDSVSNGGTTCSDWLVSFLALTAAILISAANLYWLHI